MELNNKVVLVTGSSKGLGKELVKRFSENGCNVIINYNSNELAADSLSHELNCMCIKCDIINDLELDNMLNTIISKYGKIDILVNNACYCNDSYYMDKTRKDFLYSLNVNLVSPFEIIKKVNGLMKDGIIVNMCSTDGIDTYNPLSIDYCASKSALINMTQNLSMVLDNKIIGIAPNYINTESVLEMNPDYLKDELNRIGQKELMDKTLLSKKIIEIIKSDIKTGSIVRIDSNE